MRMSTKGRYALRLMTDLARNSAGNLVSLKDISARQEISVKYLEQIVASLCKAGLLKSNRGAQGGYRLSRPPEEYTAGMILRATEGSLFPVSCLEDTPNQCPRSKNCSVLVFWQGLSDVMSHYVDGVRLSDLARLECSSEN